MPAPLRAVAPVLPPRSSSHDVAKTTDSIAEKEKADSTSDAVLQGDGLVLKLKVREDCWLNITIDDAISQQYDLKPGDVIEWKGNRAFSLDIGNPGGIEGELNGKQLQPFGQDAPACARSAEGGRYDTAKEMMGLHPRLSILVAFRQGE